MNEVAPVNRWPSTVGRTVALLARSPKELALRYRLHFEEGLDDLDRYLLTAIADDDIGQFWLFRHVQAPAGTEIIVDGAVTTSAGVAAAKRQLHVTAEDFSWISPQERDPVLSSVVGPVAIDGPAASGKTTVGEAIARATGMAFLDTGLMYRAFTLAALRAGILATDAGACGELARDLPLRAEVGPPSAIRIGEEDVTAHLRDPEVERNVSAYSAIPAVRAAMVEQQRRLAAGGRIILAGRDIGTVVLPDAPVKLFLTASEEARAERRSSQNGAGVVPHDAAVAKSDIASRDRLDSARATSPLRPADDAVIIDTTDLTLEQVIARALEQVQCATS